MIGPSKQQLRRVALALTLAGCGGPSPEVNGPKTADTEYRGSVPPPETEHIYFGPALAKRVPVHETLHGKKLMDPYRWLERVDEPGVSEWMMGYDGFTRKHLEKWQGRSALEERLKELSYLDFVGTPKRRGSHYFFRKRSKAQEKSAWYVSRGKNGKPRVLLDPNKLSEDGSVALKHFAPSWDGRKVAYKLSENNADHATVHVLDVATGKSSKVDVIDGARYAYPSWDRRSRGFYYVRLPLDKSIPETELPGHAEVYYHRLGTEPKTDRLIFDSTADPQVFTGVEASRDGKKLFVYRYHGWARSDAYLADLTQPDHKPQPLVVGLDAKFEFFAWGGWVYAHTNYKAPRWKLLRFRPKGKAISGAKDAPDHWQEIVPERADAVLKSFTVVGGHLSLSYMKNANSELQIRTLDGKAVRTIALPSLGTASNLSGLPEDDEAYYSFESFTVPDTTYVTSVRRGGSKPHFKLEAPIDATPYSVQQVWYPSKDGTQVSMFLVHRSDLKKDGSAPFFLTGYGGFNISRTPNFKAAYFAWLDAGGGLAIPNLRGGGEYGEKWHQDGMKEKKQNVFDDFIAAAEYLTQEGYTSAKRLAIAGGSNGGLLVGAAMTQRPELFGAVACFVPLLDMVRYHKFGAGKTWISEYGSADDPTQFKYLHAYSPYHQIKDGVRYPALLMLSADSDDRVDPMHARKFVASIQHAQGDPNAPVLLRVETNAGHGGGDLVKKTVELYTDVYSFLFERFGMEAPKIETPITEKAPTPAPSPG